MSHTSQPNSPKGCASTSVASPTTLVTAGAQGASETAWDKPPPGCDPDAIKLFVGNIPKSYKEYHLLALFESVGEVVSFAIVRDKVTHHSKCSGFLWYATLAHAHEAIFRLNMCHTLPDPANGGAGLPLVVRRARVHNPAAGHATSGTTPTAAAAAAVGTSSSMPAVKAASVTPLTGTYIAAATAASAAGRPVQSLRQIQRGPSRHSKVQKPSVSTSTLSAPGSLDIAATTALYTMAAADKDCRFPKVKASHATQSQTCGSFPPKESAWLLRSLDNTQLLGLSDFMHSQQNAAVAAAGSVAAATTAASYMPGRTSVTAAAGLQPNRLQPPFHSLTPSAQQRDGSRHPAADDWGHQAAAFPGSECLTSSTTSTNFDWSMCDPSCGLSLLFNPLMTLDNGAGVPDAAATRPEPHMGLRSKQSAAAAGRQGSMDSPFCCDPQLCLNLSTDYADLCGSLPGLPSLAGMLPADLGLPTGYAARLNENSLFLSNPALCLSILSSSILGGLDNLGSSYDFRAGAAGAAEAAGPLPGLLGNPMGLAGGLDYLGSFDLAPGGAISPPRNSPTTVPTLAKDLNQRWSMRPLDVMQGGRAALSVPVTNMEMSVLLPHLHSVEVMSCAQVGFSAGTDSSNFQVSIGGSVEQVERAKIMLLTLLSA